MVNSTRHKHPRFDFKAHPKDRMYGTTTVGARGQIVIPASARKDLGLQPGDQMVVMGKFGKVVALMKADQIEDLVSMIMEKIADPAIKKRIQKQSRELLKLVGKK